MEGVEFEEEQFRVEKIQRKGPSVMVEWLLKKKIAKDEIQANLLLFAVSIFVFALSIFVLYIGTHFRQYNFEQTIEIVK